MIFLPSASPLLECCHAMKKPGLKDHVETEAQLSQMFKLSLEPSQPPAKCNFVTDPRQIPAEGPPGQPKKL